MDLPPEYDAYVGWLSWMGEISTGLIMPESCVGNAYQRLLLAGLMPVVILGLVVLWAVGRRLAQCVRIRASERPRLHHAIAGGTVDALPVLLPLSYLCVTNVANQAFAVFDCVSFQVDAASGQRRYYMSSDYSVVCDRADDSYNRLWNLGCILVVTVTSLPLLYFVLLFNSRRAICDHAPTLTSRSCHFLWLDYWPDYWWFEPFNQVRKLFLTGFVMMMPERMPHARTLSAEVVTLSYICEAPCQVGGRTPFWRLHAHSSGSGLPCARKCIIGCSSTRPCSTVRSRLSCQ